MRIWLSNIVAFLAVACYSQSAAIVDDESETDSFDVKLRTICMNFLDCESEIINVHYRCTANSRNATGVACGLTDDFRELNGLMTARISEFAGCIGAGAGAFEALDIFMHDTTLETPECSKPVDLNALDVIMSAGSCWKALSVLKRQCQALQKCCLPAKTCMQAGRSSKATHAVRAKHIEINKKTLICREEMKKVMDKASMSPTSVQPELLRRAEGVLTLQGDTMMDVLQRKYVYNKLERELLRNRASESSTTIFNQTAVINRILKFKNRKSLSGIRRKQQKELEDVMWSSIREATIQLMPLPNKKRNDIGNEPKEIKIMSKRKLLNVTTIPADIHNSVIKMPLILPMPIVHQNLSFAMPSKLNLSNVPIHKNRPFINRTINKTALPSSKARFVKTQDHILKPLDVSDLDNSWTEVVLDSTQTPIPVPPEFPTNVDSSIGPLSIIRTTIPPRKTITLAPTNLLQQALQANRTARIFGVTTREKTARKVVVDGSTSQTVDQEVKVSGLPEPFESPKIKMISHNDKEMLSVKTDLVKNLEQFIKMVQEREIDNKAVVEERNRLSKLRKTAVDFFIDDEEMGYCELYQICTKQLLYVQKECKSVGGRLVPGLPKRRFGGCNRKLVDQYQRLEKLRKQVEDEFNFCLQSAIDNKTDTDACPNNWPFLPAFEDEPACVNRIRIIQNHCNKLGRCCGAVRMCREELDSTPLATKLVAREERLARASARCQIRAYNDYKKYRSLHLGEVTEERRAATAAKML